MINKIKEESFTKVCENCGTKVELRYDDAEIEINDRIIKMPKCTNCNSNEWFFLNNVDNEHGQKVSRLFANIHALKK